MIALGSRQGRFRENTLRRENTESSTYRKMRCVPLTVQRPIGHTERFASNDLDAFRTRAGLANKEGVGKEWALEKMCGRCAFLARCLQCRRGGRGETAHVAVFGDRRSTDNAIALPCSLIRHRHTLCTGCLGISSSYPMPFIHSLKTWCRFFKCGADRRVVLIYR